MRTWQDYLAGLRAKWIGVKVRYEGKIYKVVAVDENGVLHINKKTRFHKTTAAFLPHQAEEVRRKMEKM